MTLTSAAMLADVAHPLVEVVSSAVLLLALLPRYIYVAPVLLLLIASQ
jgi:hypothetical protein